MDKVHKVRKTWKKVLSAEKNLKEEEGGRKSWENDAFNLSQDFIVITKKNRIKKFAGKTFAQHCDRASSPVSMETIVNKCCNPFIM